MRTIFLSAFVVLVALSVWARMLIPPPAPPGRTVLTWVTDDNPARQDQMRLFREYAARRGRPDVDIRLDPGNGGVDKIVVQSVGGIGPDLFDMYQTEQVNTFQSAGILMDVTNPARERGFGLKWMWPALHAATAVEGRQYAVPTNCSPSAIFYNKDLFDRAGVPYPRGDWTWSEFVETARKLTRRRPGGRGYASFGVMGMTLVEPIWQAGGSVFSEDGSRCVLDAPEAIEGARFFHDLQHKHHAMPTAAEENALASAGGWGAGAMNMFLGGQCAMLVTGRFAVVNFRKTPRLRFGVAPMPHGRTHANRLLFRATGVNRNSPNAQTALLFLEFLTSEDYCRQINQSGDGISGVPQYASTPEFLHDPAHPEETDNLLWVRSMRHARDVEVSPYINPFVTNQILQNHTDLLRNGGETPEQAMTNAAAQINAQIQRNIRRDPVIRERWERRAGQKPAGATPPGAMPA